MHENCPVQEEFITSEKIWYANDNFRPENSVVGWVDIGATSRKVEREVVGRVADSVVLFPDGREKVKVRTYVKSYKGDEPLAKLGGTVTRSWENEKFEETELTQLYSREYASTLSYSHFAADPEILFPGVEAVLIGGREAANKPVPLPQPVPALAKAA